MSRRTDFSGCSLLLIQLLVSGCYRCTGVLLRRPWHFPSVHRSTEIASKGPADPPPIHPEMPAARYTTTNSNLLTWTASTNAFLSRSFSAPLSTLKAAAPHAASLCRLVCVACAFACVGDGWMDHGSRGDATRREAGGAGEAPRGNIWPGHFGGFL